MYSRNQMPFLITRKDTQNFDSRIYSNICINFLCNENSIFYPKNNNKKKKEKSLKESLYRHTVFRFSNPI